MDQVAGYSPGSEEVLDGDGRPVGTLLDFWRWSSSTLLDNTMRGMLAEFLVGLALECIGDNHRAEWDAFDLKTADGIKVEVKASAYLQSWKQQRPSTIRFDIGERIAWYAETNTYAAFADRGADVYVFCVFTETNRAEANPLDTRQWFFLVASTTALDAAVGHQKSIGLAPLRERVKPIEVGFEGLAVAVKNAGTP